MNSEELEQSLKAEFENHLSSVAEGFKRQIAEFHERMLSEFDRHRSQMDEAIREFSSRVDQPSAADRGFAELVSEHLKLARDEGAKLAATAYAEAESLAPAPAPAEAEGPSKGFAELRDAIADISSKDSQATILKALVDHASQFAARGAFFIVKSENFAGWKVFGEGLEEDSARDIHFPVSDDSILGSANRSAKMVEASANSYNADRNFLEPLGFGEPERMYAIPLVARGRSVAVLYADGSVNAEALETIVKVAGLTVELLANGAAAAPAAEETVQTAPAVEEVEAAPAFEAVPETEESTATDYSFGESEAYQESFPPATAEAYEEPSSDVSPSDDSSVEEQHPFTQPVEPEPVVQAEPQVETEPSFSSDFSNPAFSNDSIFNTQPEPVAEEPVHEYGQAMFDRSPSVEPEPEPAAPSFERAVSPFEPATAIGGMSRAIEPTGAPAEVVTTAPVRSRLGDRSVDLPIEVPEEERRPHNDARRFARLLVSEIKLYNEKKVIEGRQAHDLYDRLKEAIDRSREMYDKRVQPPVAAKFDYFHYELVNSLADGDPQKFGAGYPGASV